MKDVDLRADIYSLGCTLFHMLTGEAPYHGDTAMAVMIKHVNAPVPDMRALWPECPAKLAEVVMKMMQKRPDDRQQDYGEVCADLQRAYDVISGGGSGTGKAGKKRAAAWAIGAVAVCAAVGVLLYFAPWKKSGQLSAQNAAQTPAQSRVNAPATPGKTFAVISTPAPKTAPPPAASTTPIPRPSASPAPTPAVTPRPLTEVEKWLAQVDAPQEDAFQKQVLKPFETGAASLRARYLAGVDAGIARASAAAQLQEALAWRSERQSFEKARNVPPDDTGAPAIVKPLREDFRRQLAKLDQDRAMRAKVLLAQYDAILAQNQTLLTQNRRLDDALLLEKKREEIAFVWLRQPSLTGAGASSRGGLPFAASKEQPFVNTLGMKFVPVPGTKALFSVWDTRVRDYAAYAQAKAVNDAWKKQDRDGVPISREPVYPVVGVSLEDAQAFCQWLTEKENAEGKLPRGAKYRLPTDEEWSQAVGLPPEQGSTPVEKNGKNQTNFPWGIDYPPSKTKVGNYADSALHEKFPNARWIEGYTDGYATTSPVGSFPANAFGLYDMGGNVWQWCDDRLNKDPKERVLRGAAWNHADRSSLLSSSRTHSGPGYRGGNYGFRCVLEPGPDETPGTESRSTPSKAADPAHEGLEKALPDATKEAPFVNSLGMKFVPVPGAKALFSVWDTRVQDYEAFAADTGRRRRKPDFEQGPTHPVVNVNWNDAQAFCAWLTERERKLGKLGASEAYRLPTDQEWSFAVGIGEQEDPAKLPKEKSRNIRDAFPWGAQWPPPDNAGNYASLELKTLQAAGKYLDIKDTLPGYHDGYANTSPVGAYPANRPGLFDMGGNVWQWCEDWLDNKRKARVLRGGSWKRYTRDALLSSERFDYPPASGFDDFGFRCVLGAAEVSAPAAGKEPPFVNTLGMEFLPVPGTKARFSIWDTRVQDFEVFARETGHEWRKPDFEQGPTHPAVNVSWDDAQAFCAWLTERERKSGKLGAGEEYRLPSDHEWSCAAGIGDREDPAKLPGEKSGKIDNVFAWGAQWPPPDNAGNYADAAFHEKFPNQKWVVGYKDGFATSSPVGSFPANAYGLYDIGGNVWNWCEDWYDNTRKERVQRVAPWAASERYQMLLSYRGRSVPGNRFAYYGFRCVLKSVQDSAAAAESRPASSSPAGSDRPALEKALPAAAKDAPFVNTLGMKFVPVPGTEALFSIWDTRVQDYTAYAQVNKVDGDWKKSQEDGVLISRDPEYPVVAVNWDDAHAFCQWLTEKESAEGKLPRGAKYRLPTDEEWSRAVGLAKEDGATPKEKSGKDQASFPWGGAFPPPKEKVGNYADSAFHEKFPNRRWIEGYNDGYVTTSPVGAFPPNKYGLYDIGGNVWQWCEDIFESGGVDPVQRGASWRHDLRGNLLSSNRNRNKPGLRSDDCGFRCVLAGE
jgi:formylglycine-generating enzyme required for sulfatase activity